MDEYHCDLSPDITADDQYFNVEFVYSDMYVLSLRNLHTHCDTANHSFPNISKDNMMQETTIVAMLSDMGAPEYAHEFMAAEILDFARDMANRTHKHQKVLSMFLNMTIPRFSEDAISELYDDDNDDDGFDRKEDPLSVYRKALSMNVDVVIPPVSQDAMSEDDDDDDDDDFEEEEEVEDDGVVEESMEEDQDHGLVPAAKSSIEGLEMVRVEQEGSLQGRCAICFEDFLVGVRMPCLHMFHKNCIFDWLQIGNSCPLCRFQMPTRESE